MFRSTAPRACLAICVFACLLLVPTTGSAQRVSAEIAGVVHDTTGGVLPGVTVEASSPALIEKVRSVISDEKGQYRILDLRPGVYTVTFTLPGFNTVKREGVELTANFTATISAELQVGSVTETITVSGATPVVDVQNVIQEKVLTRDVLETVPTAKYYDNYAVLTPGIMQKTTTTNSNQNVGGMLGNSGAEMTIHGGKGGDQQILFDGMNVLSLSGLGTGIYIPSDGNVQEYNLVVGANPAEAETGGVRINLVPRDGGNTFQGSLLVSGSNSHMQSNNVDAALTGAGLVAPNRLKRQYDYAPTLGGPIKRNTLWFFTAYRYYRNDRTAGGIYYNLDPKAWVYQPDTTRPGVQDSVLWDANVRLTWQAAPKHKFTFYYVDNYNCECHRYLSAQAAPEAALHLQFKNKITQSTWTALPSSRLLFEAGVSFYHWRDIRDLEPEATEPAILDQSKNLTYRSRLGGPSHAIGHNLNSRASMSYVSKSHSVKVGFTSLIQTVTTYTDSPIGDISYRMLNGSPNQVTYYATPYYSPVTHGPDIGVFAQDQWTLDRLTLNGGLRFDWLRSSYGAVSLPATRYMVARQFASGNVENLKDLSPRLSASYDLFGTGKTALKVSASRYVLQTGSAYINAVAPVGASNNTSSRTWTDNGDFIVQGDPFNPATNMELGPGNVNFGKAVLTTHADPKLDTGFGVRPYNWEMSAGIQHELLPRVSVSAMYFRRWYGNFVVNQSLDNQTSDYTPYCLTAPVDPRLPSGGGYPLCGLFDVTPTQFGHLNNLRTSAKPFGNEVEHWNGFDLTMSARLPRGVTLQGGMSTGKDTTDACAILKNHPEVTVGVTTIENAFPNQATGPAGRVGQYCHQETPWLTDVKFLGSYPLPAGLQVSATLQSTPGSPVYANWVASYAIVSQALSRGLSSGVNGSVSLNIIPPGSMYLDRVNELDLRLTKAFQAGATRIRGMVDFYNALNANTVVTANATYGTDGKAWLVPQVILTGRIVKLSAQLSF